MALGTGLADFFKLDTVSVDVLSEPWEVAVGADLLDEGLEVGLHRSLGGLGVNRGDDVVGGVEVEVTVMYVEVAFNGFLDLRVRDSISGQSSGFISHMLSVVYSSTKREAKNLLNLICFSAQSLNLYGHDV